MKGEDQCVNIILDNCQERIYSIDEGVKMDEIGVYLIRGDDMYIYSNYSLIVQLLVKLIRAQMKVSTIHRLSQHVYLQLSINLLIIVCFF